METVVDILKSSALEIISIILSGIFAFIALKLKTYLKAKLDTEEKKNVAKMAVTLVEQTFKELHGEDKYNEAVKYVSHVLAEKGISVTETEIKLLIESALGEANKVFEAK